jgi:uncharacterized membrane protein YbjE (DUF340 family)
MNHAMKAALLSGLVFPGLGQAVLKHYKRAIVLMFTVSASLLAIIVKASQSALAILDKIQLEGGAINMGTISKAAVQETTASDSLTINLLSLLILVCWIVGIIDATIAGRKKDIEKHLAAQASDGDGR